MLTTTQQIERRALKEGIKLGMQEGRQEEKLGIAKEMLFQLGLDLATVQKATGLARAVLEELQAAGQ